MTKLTLHTTLEYMKGECNKRMYGRCSIRKCLINGGYAGKGPVDLEIATCEYNQACRLIELFINAAMKKLAKEHC